MKTGRLLSGWGGRALGVATAVAACVAGAGWGCGGSSGGVTSEIVCGPGTALDAGECVAILVGGDAAAFCGPGTTLAGGVCVATSSLDAPSETDATVTVTCGPGTMMSSSGECVVVPLEGGVTCGAGTMLTGNMCVPASSSGSEGGIQPDSGGATDGASSDAGDGGCPTACALGKVCVSGKCVSCGAMDEPCCAPSMCNSNLTCDTTNTCTCGAPGEACCSANPSCSSGSTCNGQNICACGAAGEPCCSATSGQSACSESSLSCASAATGTPAGNCSCLVGCNQNVVQRSDGTMWLVSTSAPSAFTVDGTNPLHVQNFQANYSLGAPSGLHYFCAVTTAGGVVCQGNDNSSGQLGSGSTSNSGVTIPVTVVGGGNTPLTGITNVWVDTVFGSVACAINAQGAAWCWGANGNGQLGNGSTSNSRIAFPVLSSGTPTSPGPQFTGVKSMAVASEHVCALKTDGTVWCWGLNSVGQIGTGTTSTAQYANPVQVTLLGTHAVDIATTSGNNQNLSCARTDDTGMYCWGTNYFGSLNIGTTDGNPHPTPIQISSQADGGGGPLLNVSAMSLSGGGAVYVVQSSSLAGYPNTLSCWDCGGSGGIMPVVVNSVAVTGIHELCPQMSTGVSYIDSLGQMWFDDFYGNSNCTLPACP